MIFKIHNTQTKEIVFVKVEGTAHTYQHHMFYYCALENDIELLKEYIRLACRTNNDPNYQTNIIITSKRKSNIYKLDKFYGEHLNNFTVELVKPISPDHLT